MQNLQFTTKTVIYWQKKNFRDLTAEIIEVNYDFWYVFVVKMV